MNLKKRFTKKRFGQHWLINEKILEKIRQTANLDEDDFILEIGPGRGALTSRLLDSKIIGLHAVELDKDLIEFLTKKFSSYLGKVPLIIWPIGVENSYAIQVALDKSCLAVDSQGDKLLPWTETFTGPKLLFSEF